MKLFVQNNPKIPPSLVRSFEENFLLCSSGYGRRLMFQRSWVRILAVYNGWTWHFFTMIWCQKLYSLFEKTENKRKRGRDWTILKKKLSSLLSSLFLSFVRENNLSNDWNRVWRLVRRRRNKTFSLKATTTCHAIAVISVARSGDLLDFGQLLNAFGNT